MISVAIWLFSHCLPSFSARSRNVIDLSNAARISSCVPPSSTNLIKASQYRSCAAHYFDQTIFFRQEVIVVVVIIVLAAGHVFS
jgi:hypothetical protein